MVTHSRCVWPFRRSVPSVSVRFKRDQYVCVRCSEWVWQLCSLLEPKVATAGGIRNASFWASIEQGDTTKLLICVDKSQSINTWTCVCVCVCVYKYKVTCMWKSNVVEGKRMCVCVGSLFGRRIYCDPLSSEKERTRDPSAKWEHLQRGTSNYRDRFDGPTSIVCRVCVFVHSTSLKNGDRWWEPANSRVCGPRLTHCACVCMHACLLVKSTERKTNQRAIILFATSTIAFNIHLTLRHLIHRSFPIIALFAFSIDEPF